MRKHDKKSSVCGFYIFGEGVLYRVNREASWLVLRMYDMGGKLLDGIKSIYDESLVYIRVKGNKSEWFRTDSVVRQGFIMSPWLFNVYMDIVMKEVKMGIGRRGVRFLEEERV